MKQTRLCAISFLLTLLLSPPALLNASEVGCGKKLADYGKSSGRITNTLANRVHIAIANGARWWRREATPAKVQAADNLIARLESDLKYDDRLPDAIQLVKSHINVVEISYRIIKDHVRPMRDIFKKLRLDLNKKSSENLDEVEIQTLEAEFLGIAENYAPTNTYSRLSGDRKNIRALRTMEEILSKRNGKPIKRAEIVKFLTGFEYWMNGQEVFYARQIGRHFVKYERLKAYLSASYENRSLPPAVIAKVSEEAVAHSEIIPNEELSASQEPTKEEVLAARKKKWETNVRHLNDRVGWNSDAQARLGIHSEAPTLAEVMDYYNESHIARLVDNRGSSIHESFRSLVAFGIHLTGVGAVVRPTLAYVFSGPGKFKRSMNVIREWSVKTHKAQILKDIQELVEAPESTLEKAANLASYASDANTGTYFLQLFASDVDLYSNIVWKEIMDEVSSSPDHYYSVLAAKMKAAQDKVKKDGTLTSIQTSSWSPSQSASVAIWILGIGYYNFFGDEDEELDNKVSEHLKEELSDITNSVVKPDSPSDADSENTPTNPESAPEVKAPPFEELFPPEAAVAPLVPEVENTDPIVPPADIPAEPATPNAEPTADTPISPEPPLE